MKVGCQFVGNCFTQTHVNTSLITVESGRSKGNHKGGEGSNTPQEQGSHHGNCTAGHFKTPVTQHLQIGMWNKFSPKSGRGEDRK